MTAEHCAARFNQEWARERQSRHPSLPRAYFRAFGLLYAVSGLYLLLQDMLEFTRSAQRAPCCNHARQPNAAALAAVLCGGPRAAGVARLRVCVGHVPGRISADAHVPAGGWTHGCVPLTHCSSSTGS